MFEAIKKVNRLSEARIVFLLKKASVQVIEGERLSVLKQRLLGKIRDGEIAVENLEETQEE